ncbi:MAG: hypothetical protein KGK03_03580 [Candidatus Omnitrophica bacterium]|nr:hypothetical protein [Candidatus Omnitrophota bacterium]MDE2222135.1 hypothetical protein [Candidatus Omnitrophota bacterium]
MRFPLIVVLFLLWWSFDACAQVAHGPSSSAPEDWQMTLDTIQARAQTLMGQNTQLQSEYRQLQDQAEQLRRMIAEQQDKNERISRFLQQRRGTTDQQIRIAALERAIKAERPQVRQLKEQAHGLKRNLLDILPKLKQLQDQGAPQDEAGLEPWHKQLEDENRKEAVLTKQLKDLKSTAMDPVALKDLRRQKLQERKEELETDINAYEMRLDELRTSALDALSWETRKKELVHEMAQVDARNNQMQGQVKVLQEDVAVLKSRVFLLQRQIISQKGM